MGKNKKPTGLHPSTKTLFLRTQGECFRQMFTPMLMYTFMSMLILATFTVKTLWLSLLLGVLCIAASIAFDAHLSYTCGKTHYDFYMTGNLHRQREAEGFPSGSDHKLECEYRPWKGFYIGFLVGIPVIILGSIAGATSAMASQIAYFLLITLAGWAIAPVLWINNNTGLDLNYALSLAFIVIPILVSGIFYLIGAKVEKGRKEAQAARDEAVRKLQEQQQYERTHRVQTEEQKKKTLQSKKKK